MDAELEGTAKLAGRRVLIMALLALAAAVMLAGSARAAITGSSITSPADLSYFVADNDAASSDVTISGTTSGGNPLSDKIDVRCYYGAGLSVLVRSGRSLNPDGSFSFPAPLGSVANHICVLRAIPESSFPTDLTPFTGPRIATGERTTFTVAGGPNWVRSTTSISGRSSGQPRSSTARTAAARCLPAICSMPR